MEYTEISQETHGLPSGYIKQAHRILTEDGYIITVTRFLQESESDVNFFDKQSSGGKPPVLLTPGFLCSGEFWCFLEPDKGLPYKLLEEGYDCWYCDFRGSLNSLGHSKLPTNSAQYWSFSLHEMGVYDLPAMITYILTTTGNKSLSCIGHSMGISALLVTLVSLPEFCQEKIKVVIAFAPAMYGEHVKFILKTSFLVGVLLGKSKKIRDRQVAHFSAHTFLKYLFPSDKIAMKCGVFLFKRVGAGLGACNRDMKKEKYKTIISKWPASSSLKVYSHGCQAYFFNKARQFDYGRAGNEKIYGQGKPPSYDFTKASVPVALFCSKDDGMATPQDVSRLAQQLPNCIGTFHVANFTHIDFFMGKQAHEFLYPKAMQILSQFHDKK